MTFTKDQLDIICGVKRPQTPHELKVGDRVITNDEQFKFYPGREGTVISFDEYNLPVVRLDILPRLLFTFHPTHLALELGRI